MANKLIEAAKEAVRVAQCEHILMPMPSHLAPYKFSRTLCTKCGASFYEPLRDPVSTQKEPS